MIKTGGASLPCIVAICAVIIATILRSLCASGELWLDELWSIVLLEDVQSPSDLLLKVRHDNNHLLNSLWMWVLGPTASPIVYRIPSILYAAMTLACLAIALNRSGFGWSGAIWSVLIATSYPLVLLGSEARGYALSLLCAMICFLVLVEAARGQQQRYKAYVFSVAAILGILSHGVFIPFYISALAWLLYLTLLQRGRVASWLWIATIAPTLIAILIGFFFYREIVIGGGPQASYLQVFLSTLSVSFGGTELSAFNPQGAAVAALLAVLVALIIIIELILWVRERDPISILVAVSIIFPVAIVLIVRPSFILSRYFALPILLSYLVAARFLCRLARQGALGGAIAVLAIGGYLWGNGQHVFELMRYQRSHAVRIFQEARASSAEQGVSFGGDQDNRNELRLRYGRMIDPALSSIVYVPDFSNATSAPDFIVREWLERGVEIPQSFTGPHGDIYALRHLYTAPLLSGATAGVYAKQASQ